MFSFMSKPLEQLNFCSFITIKISEFSFEFRSVSKTDLYCIGIVHLQSSGLFNAMLCFKKSTHYPFFSKHSSFVFSLFLLLFLISLTFFWIIIIWIPIHYAKTLNILISSPKLILNKWGTCMKCSVCYSLLLAVAETAEKVIQNKLS